MAWSRPTYPTFTIWDEDQKIFTLLPNSAFPIQYSNVRTHELERSGHEFRRRQSVRLSIH